ncbi:MAG: sulfatase-like hydrolase/transferase [Chitinophagaceae bacterium]
MKTSLLHNRWFTAPVFFLLLPIFFVVHGWQENFAFIPATDIGLLLLMYLVAALVLYAIAWLWLRNQYKAALASFALMALHFFFGGIHDLLKRNFENAFISKYAFILPLCLLLIIIMLIALKRKKSSLQKAAAYLNMLLALLIIIDVARILLPKQDSPDKKTGVTLNCDSCYKPDIYFVLLDEYTGNDALRDLFNFDNAAFEQQLTNRGFHVVPHSRSNYNYTPFSMASILNMQYLQLENTERKKPDITYAFRLINQNEVTALLEQNGYSFYNHSVFDLPGRPMQTEETFIPSRTKLITAQTLLSRLNRDLGYHLVTTLKIKKAVDHQAYRIQRSNARLYDLTWKQSAAPHTQPQFIYTHLMMPHYPYYFDRNGKPMDPARVLPEANNMNRKDYVEYMQYVNKKILDLTDHILQASAKPPVIIVMSDHGFRHFNKPVALKYHFMNLNAVYLPGKDYSGFYDSVSNVNQFRLIFNSVFKTGLPLLKDTSIYLKD